MTGNLKVGIATSIGEQPIKGLINADVGARMAVAESLTNLVFAPISCLEVHILYLNCKVQKLFLFKFFSLFKQRMLNVVEIGCGLQKCQEKVQNYFMHVKLCVKL